jgi:hypothetical protein
LRRSDVPRSSSATKVLDNPVIAPKKITIHNNAEANSLEIVSPAIVKEMVEIVITINNIIDENA